MESAAQAPEVEGEVRWDLPVAYNDRVEYWINFLKGRNHDKTKLWLERKSHYEPMILGKLRERGMPEDLIYLAMIESGFSPRAYSKAHASGIWQFIAETGRRYGLQISGHLDERRDPVKATDAALDYLQKLHRQFGSWYLAAAAYNSGEGRVQRILNQRMGGARGDDELFWKIDQYLPRETRDYVPLMLAAAHIGKEPEKYGFRDLQPQAPMRYDGVEVPGGTALRSVARAAGVDIGEVQQLNPQFLHDATPPGRVMTVRIPEGRNEVFALNFERVREEERVSVPRVATASASTTGRQHTVRKGETLSHIARHYGTTVRQIQAANSGLDPNRVRSGQRIRIPGLPNLHGGPGERGHRLQDPSGPPGRIALDDLASLRRHGPADPELEQSRESQHGARRSEAADSRLIRILRASIVP